MPNAQPRNYFAETGPDEDCETSRTRETLEIDLEEFKAQRKSRPKRRKVSDDSAKSLMDMIKGAFITV